MSFMDVLTAVNDKINSVVWGVPALILLIGTGFLQKGPWHPGCDPQSSPKSRSPSRGTLRFSGTPSSEPFLPS